MTPLRILLVPSLTELEWPIRPLIEEWAETASFDVPWVSAEPPAEGHLLDVATRRAFDELDRRGWDRCVVVGDDWGSAIATRMAELRPAAVQALVLGHACLRYSREGARPSLNSEVADLLLRLASVDFRTFARQMFTGWDPRIGATGQQAGHESAADQYIERVSPEAARAFLETIMSMQTGAEPSLAENLRGFDAPLMLVKHEGCLLFTPEGFEDAATAIPSARTAATPVKPSVSPEFAAILRDFCETVVAGQSDEIRPG